MGKIKGWKKIEKGYWKQDNYRGKGYPLSVELRAVRPRGTGARWSLSYGIHDTSFTSETEALRFARKYMRTHPRG